MSACHSDRLRDQLYTNFDKEHKSGFTYIDFFMFRPNIFTITWNTHKVSLQNYYATALPHQKRHKCRRPCPHNYKHVVLAASPNPARICPFCKRKRKSSGSLAGICMKQTTGGLRTPYLLFCREPQNSPHASASWRAYHPLPLPYFLAMPQNISEKILQKPIWKTFTQFPGKIPNGSFSRKLCKKSGDTQGRHSLLKI